VSNMPAQTPPEAVSIGSARARLSASSLTSWLRCQKQWFTRYKLGLRSPLRPRQVLGILVEDALLAQQVMVFSNSMTLRMRPPLVKLIA
jgi:hypothetical protein